MAELDGEPRPRATGLDLRVRARQENVAEVRRAFENLDLPPRLLDDAKLLASELVTNSIRHSGLAVLSHSLRRTLALLDNDEAICFSQDPFDVGNHVVLGHRELARIAPDVLVLTDRDGDHAFAVSLAALAHHADVLLRRDAFL